MKPARNIFCGVFIFSFVTQVALRSYYTYLDTSMWADQIKYFLSNDPRVFDYYAAYGHPGTTLVELGCLLNRVFGFSYNNAIIISISTIVAMATAACSAVCFSLHQWSYWWLTTAVILTFNRLSLYSTPPTEAVMPFIVLIVLFTWWVIEKGHIKSGRRFFMLGCIAGLSAATRLDVTLLVCMPMTALIWHKYGHKAILYTSFGVGVSFFLANPFLWFMPVQHLNDLVHKFTLHHNQFNRHEAIRMISFVHASPLAVVSIVWSCILLFQRRIALIIPARIIVVYFCISVFGLIVILSSSFQAIRYLYPLIIVWEILLPLFVFERFTQAQQKETSGLSFPVPASSKIILGFVVCSQFFASRIGFDLIAGVINYCFHLGIEFTIPFNA